MRKRPRVESDEDGALSKSRARKFGIPKTRESMKRRFSAPNAHNTGANNPTKWMTAVILFNGRGGIFSQTSLDDIRRLWRQYAVHQTGLPKIRGTDAPKDILPVVPRLVDVYTFFAKLKDMESMTSYVANKEYALSFALLGFRKAYDAAGLHYDQDTNARANLRILLGKEFSHQPDSALIKLYLLQKMSESNGIQFKGARRTAPISFFESQLQRAEKYVFLNEIFGPGVLILLPGYIESHE